MKSGKVILAFALAVCLIAACGRSDNNTAREQAMKDAAARQGIDADVTVNDQGEAEQIVIKMGGGQVGRNLDLPAGFPDDIKLPADWDIMAASSPLPGSHSLQALSNSSREDILQDIRARLTADGWAETAFDSPTPHMAQINLEKGDRTANFNILENGDTRMIQILTMPKP